MRPVFTNLRKRLRPVGLLTGPFWQRARTGAGQVHAHIARAGRGRVPLLLWWVTQAYLYFVWRRKTLPAIPKENWPNNDAAQIYGKGWCLTPADLRFAKACGADDPLDCVFPVETKGAHALLNQGRDGAKAALKLLHDKAAAAAHFAAHDLPIMPTLCQVEAAATLHLDQLFKDHDALFLKGRVSARGQGAMKLWQGDDGALQGLKFGGGVLADDAAVKAAIDDLARLGPFLVQPYAAPHPQLTPLCADDEVPTVRVITQDQGTGGIAILLATLELPQRDDADDARTHYRFVSIDASSGALTDHEMDLPFWDLIREGSVAAHHATQGPWAIAWDWVVTQEGAFLLEGNGGFALGELQRRKGPLLGAGGLAAHLLNH